MLIDKGHLCDFADPCSGLPFHSKGNNVYDEVGSMQVRDAVEMYCVLYPKRKLSIVHLLTLPQGVISVFHYGCWLL